jgi:RNA polymerase sigma factor (sigma-70 family)
VRPLERGLTSQAPKVEESSAHGSDEGELVASVLRKDRKAAARFVAGHIDAVYAYARHRLAPSSDLVDDVVQDVFLSALKGLATFEAHSSLRTWLIAIARHKIEDIYRQRLRLPEAIEDLDRLEKESSSRDTNAALDEQIDSDTRTRESAKRPGADARTIRPDAALAVLGTPKYSRDGGRYWRDGEERRTDAVAGA